MITQHGLLYLLPWTTASCRKSSLKRYHHFQRSFCRDGQATRQPSSGWHLRFQSDRAHSASACPIAVFHCVPRSIATGVVLPGPSDHSYTVSVPHFCCMNEPFFKSFNCVILLWLKKWQRGIQCRIDWLHQSWITHITISAMNAWVTNKIILKAGDCGRRCWMETVIQSGVSIYVSQIPPPTVVFPLPFDDLCFKKSDQYPLLWLTVPQTYYEKMSQGCHVNAALDLPPFQLAFSQFCTSMVPS